MPIFIDLPLELLLGVFIYLDAPDLGRVSQVSHHLHIVVEPILYQTVELADWGSTPSPFQMFMSSIQRRPIRASYVRFLTLEWEGSDTISFPPSVTNIHQLSIAASMSGDQESQGAQVLVLLHLLPRLQVLDLTPPIELDLFDEFMDEHAYIAGATLPVGLQSIREIHCYWCDSESGVNPETLLAMLMLPSIRVVDVRFVMSMDNLQLEIDCARFIKMSTVTDLRFGFGDVDSSSLAKIFCIPRALTHFSYGDKNAGGRYRCDAPGLGRALSLVESTLQYLVISFNDDIEDSEGEDEDDEDNKPQTICSLREWPVLWKVKCSLTLLLGKEPRMATARLVDVLPIVIREFEIECDPFWSNNEALNQLVDLMEQKKVCGLSWLAVLIVWNSQVMMDARLRAACGAAGVTLAITQSSPQSV